MLVNPVVGPVVDGKQRIVLNSKNGLGTEVISTPEKVDKFLLERENCVSNGVLFTFTGLGAVLGGVASYLGKMKSVVAIGSVALLGALLGFLTAGAVAENKMQNLDQKFIDANK